MKIEYKIYCHKHGEGISIVDVDVDQISTGLMPHSQGITLKTVTIYVGPCSECMSESYERGIESLLSKGWEAK